jgi:2-keto-4-pentenoate hydratase/2-oxohepta-3-ene-1,7-dioic acid hydratase in catechol pathway
VGPGQRFSTPSARSVRPSGLVGPLGLRISCSVNDELRQEASTEDMVFGVARSLPSSQVMTSFPAMSC